MTTITAVTFDESDTEWDADNRQVMKFRAFTGTTRIMCAISREALGDHFGPQAHPRDIFSSNRATIEGIAEKLIRHGRFEKDGSIFIRGSDVR